MTSTIQDKADNIRAAIREYEKTGSLVINPIVATEAAERLREIIPSVRELTRSHGTLLVFDEVER